VTPPAAEHPVIDEHHELAAENAAVRNAWGYKPKDDDNKNSVLGTWLPDPNKRRTIEEQAADAARRKEAAGLVPVTPPEKKPPAVSDQAKQMIAFWMNEDT
jgi:hypothetical protein